MRNLIFLFLIIFSGCIPRSDRTRPLSLPLEYYEEKFAPVCPADEIDLSSWWEQFNDPLLNDLIQKSLKCSYDIRIACQKINESRGLYKIARASLFPEIDLNASAQRTRESETLSDSPFLGNKIQNLFQIGFDATWELDFFGKNASTTKAALYDLFASEEDYNDVKIIIIAEVARNYITIRSLQERIAIAYKHMENEKELIELADDRFKAGLTSEIDILQGKALLKEREARLFLLDLTMKQLIYGLGILVGDYPETLGSLLDKCGCIPCAEGRVPVGLPSDLLRQRPDVRRAEWQLYASQARLNSSIAELFPTFSLTSSIGYASSSIGDLFNPASRTWNIGSSLFWPIFDAGRIRAGIRVQTSRQRQALLNFEKSVINGLSDVEKSLVGYYREIQRQESLNLEVKSLKLISIDLEDLYTSGLRNFSDLLENQRLLFDAEDLRAQSKENSMNQLIALFKALGGGWQCSSTP